MRAWCKNSKATRGVSTLEGGGGGREGGDGPNPRKPREMATDKRRGINAERRKRDCCDVCVFFGITCAPSERKEAGTMSLAARGTASPWFTGNLLMVK